MASSSAPEPLTCIARLTARPGQRDALAQALTALLAPTRDEPGCLDYVLFEQSDQPGSFYMREAFQDEAAFQAHLAAPYFQAFAARLDELLAQPLEVVRLSRVG